VRHRHRSCAAARHVEGRGTSPASSGSRFAVERLAAGSAAHCAGKICQSVPGTIVDAAVAALVIEMMSPMTLAQLESGLLV